jgi:transposase
MTKKSLWVGLDVGADETTVCATDDSGAVLFEIPVATKPAALHAVLRRDKRRISLIGLESGSFGIVLYRSLVKLGYPLAMFEARQASKFLSIRKNKTDRNDARGLADIARLGRGSVSQVRVKAPECQRLRSTLVTRQKLVQLRTAIEANMRSLFRLNGGKLRSSHSAATLRKNVADELRRLRRFEKIDLSEEIEPLLTLSTATRAYIDDLDGKLSKQAEEDPVCQRFLEIPGIGPITALAFYSAVDDPRRFHKNADIGAYFGLVPRVRQSGRSTTRTGITKAGDKLTRTYLTTAAQIHLRTARSSLALWATNLSERLSKRGVHVALARRLAVTMLAIWKSGDHYDPNYRTLATSNRRPMIDLDVSCGSGRLGNRNHH